MVVNIPLASGTANRDSGYNVNYALSADYRNSGQDNPRNDDNYGEEYAHSGSRHGSLPQHGYGTQYPHSSQFPSGAQSPHGPQYPHGPHYQHGPQHRNGNHFPKGHQYKEEEQSPPLRREDEHDYGKPAAAPPPGETRDVSNGDFVTLNNQNKLNLNRKPYNSRTPYSSGHHYYGSRTSESQQNPYNKHNYVNHTPYDVAAERAQHQLNLHGGRAGDSSSRLGAKVAAVQAELDPTPAPPIEYHPPVGQHCGFEDDEDDCKWDWDPADGLRNLAGFEVVSSQMLRDRQKDKRPEFMRMPGQDSKGSKEGKFLFMGLYPVSNYSNTMAHIRSPYFKESGEKCRLEVQLNIRGFNDISNPVRMLVETTNHTTFVLLENINNATHEWLTKGMNVGSYEKFRIILEVMFGFDRPAYVAFDDISLVNCATDRPGMHVEGECDGIKCPDCIQRRYICDLESNCKDGEDENHCDTLGLPEGSRCSFEQQDWCGWENAASNADDMDWKLHRGETDKDRTGPSFDHTYRNESGYYLLLELPNIGDFGMEGSVLSPVFPPPPCYHRNPTSTYYNSCTIRFWYHKKGNFGGSMHLEIVLPKRKPEKKIRVEQVGGDKGDAWIRFTGVLPPDVREDYQLRISYARGSRHRADLAIDDFTLAPECFGIGVPEDEKSEKLCPDPPSAQGTDYPYHDSTTYIPFRRDNVWKVGTCDAQGREGPSVEQCTAYYQPPDFKEPLPIVRPPSQSLPGYQTWMVPWDGYYMLIAKGASGGSGVQTQGLKTRGGVAKGGFYFKRDTSIHVLVGHEGVSACADVMASDHRAICTERSDPPDTEACEHTESSLTKLQSMRSPSPVGGGGGGGGATFVFINEDGTQAPRVLLVAGGGGGLAWTNSTVGAAMQGGHLGNTSAVAPTLAALLTNVTSGTGPGGVSVRGHAHHGEGGSSFATGLSAATIPGAHSGPGVLYIVRAPTGECGCDHLCLYLDELHRESKCVCNQGWYLDDDGHSCLSTATSLLRQTTYTVCIVLGIVIMIIISLTFICCYNRYQRKKLEGIRSDLVDGPDDQLSRIRATSGITEYNPNYEFGGGSCTIKDLKEIPRQNLTLVKALGQGAFGEVYQGYLKNYAGDSVEMPVAVKTLTEMSNNQAEMDFLMEALIMSKFRHPNIVHFIGVCFGKLPRFIVLELLSGGDLKVFLRDSRPKPDRPSSLVMRDLLLCAIDVAKGCAYLEENHFIHRDIAARNCLLTTRGPGRVVKIADFGMARDIYRNDYYRKGGKAMLPVKWMPPEAFLDGIFTSKTDVWSFGVLLWEVMSLGYMPYPGRGNRDVMQLVTNGGRLEPPSHCPPQIYRIMTQCWHPQPEERPSFVTTAERLGYCLQDPDVVNSPLPIFQRPPSTERDTTVMRPHEEDPSWFTLTRPVEEPTAEVPQSPGSQDYLIPMIPSSCSLGTVRSELNSTPSLDSGPDCCQMERLLDQKAAVPPTPLAPPDWETSFTTEPTTVDQPPPPLLPTAATPLLLSPPESPSPQDARERLMLLGDRAPTTSLPITTSQSQLISDPQPSSSAMSHPTQQTSSSAHEPAVMIPMQAMGASVVPSSTTSVAVPATTSTTPTHSNNNSSSNSKRSSTHRHYHPHRLSNSGCSSNNSSSSGGSSSTGSNSSSSGGSSNSSVSTLPLDASTLPCSATIPPPLQYVNVDVTKRSPEYNEAYVIHEKREHREISC